MKSSINNWVQSNRNVLRGTWNVSTHGFSRRFALGFLELVPQLIFYSAHGVIIFSMFQLVQSVVIPKTDLMIFLLIMICIDAMGDALMFKGIIEYLRSLRRGQTLYYLLSPGTALFKVLFFRWDMPMVVFGLLSGIAAVVLSFIAHGTSPIAVAFCIAFGVITHIILTSAFHIIQAYFDPSMPIPMGSPASRLYTRPMHLVVSGSIGLGIMMTVYPVYFITAFPSAIATGSFVGALPEHEVLWYLIGILCLFIWGYGLNRIVKKSCQERQN